MIFDFHGNYYNSLKGAIIDEITEPIWTNQTENDQNDLITEISGFDDIAEGLRKSVRVAALAKLAKDSDKLNKADAEKAAKHRKASMKSIDKNYENELRKMMDNMHNQQNSKTAERMRQINLAKVRRAKKMIEKDNANDLFSSFMREATTVSENTEKRLKNVRENQVEVVKKRLDARKKKLEALSEKQREEEAQKQIENFFDEDNIKVLTPFLGSVSKNKDTQKSRICIRIGIREIFDHRIRAQRIPGLHKYFQHYFCNMFNLKFFFEHFFTLNFFTSHIRISTI